MKYDLDLQKLYLGVLLCDGELASRVRNITDEKFFDIEIRKAVKEILNYIDTYNSIPDPQYVESKTGIHIKTPDKIDDAIKHWFIDEYPTFCLHKSLENAVVESSELVAKQDYDGVENLIKKAMETHLVNDYGLNYGENPKERLLNILNRSGNIPSGFLALDHVIGCMNFGDLVIYAGGPGTGKSLFLQNNSLSHMLDGRNVVYITLELHPELCSRRMDAMLLETPTKHLYNNIDATDLAIKSKLKQNNAGTMTVKYMPSGTKTSQIKAYIKEYMINTGVKPDVVAIDYLDLVSPVEKVSVGDTFNKDKAVCEELRNIMQEYEILCLTASQLNRTAVGSDDLDHSHIAGGMSKINTADLVLGILTSNAMREKGVYELQILKTRNSSGTGRKIRLDFLSNCMKIKDNQEFLNNINTYMSNPSSTSTVMSDSQKIMNQVQNELNEDDENYSPIEDGDDPSLPSDMAQGMGSNKLDKIRDFLSTDEDDED